MTFAAGTRLGPYEIVSVIGAGGMRLESASFAAYRQGVASGRTRPLASVTKRAGAPKGAAGGDQRR